MPFIYIVEANIHSFKHATCSSISKYKCRCGIVKTTHLLRTRPVTSYVAAMFHPTIGQHAHQSLSNAATLELGMIPPRIRVNAGLHIAKGHNQPNQHHWVYQAINNRPSQHSPKTNHCLHATKQSLHSTVKKAKTTRDNPKKKMSIVQFHQTTQSFSWPCRGQNNSAATHN